MGKMKELPKVERPRERLIKKGAENLKEKELLAVLLRTGTAGKSAINLAEEIIRKYPSRKLLKVSYSDLIKIEGISTAKACTILSAIELVKRALKVKEETLPVVRSVEDVLAQIVYMRDKKREHLMAICLNARHEMIYKKPLFIGTLNASLVHPRDIFSLAIEKNAAYVIIAHNHPSGDARPSEDDLRITKRIKEAGRIIGIDLLDHVIISKNNYYSAKEEGHI